MLHLEIVTERLRREATLSLVVTTPTITYEVELKSGERVSVYSPPQFPEYGDIAKVWEPYVAAEILVPAEYVGPVTPLLYEHEAVIESTENFSEGRLIIKVVMPLRELMRNFFDKMKSVTAGYASISYDLRELREAEVARLDLLVADEPVAAFTRIVAKHRAYEEAVAAVEKLYKILPRQLFTTKIQAQALGRILSSKTLSAMSKDVTQHMYGGDITRKMKLREKQKKGKKRMLNRGRVNIPEEVFLKIADVIFETQQNELIPALIAIMENHPTPKTIELLKKHQQKAGAPLVRNYCNLSLYRLKQEGPYGDNLIAWVSQQQNVDLIRFRPLLSVQERETNSFQYELTPQETSRLLVEAFETFASTQDDKAIDLLISVIQQGNAKNKYALIGLLMRAIQ